MSGTVVNLDLSEALRDLPAELPEAPAGVIGIPVSSSSTADVEWEHNATLRTNRRRARTYRKMMRTSAVIGMGRRLLTGHVTGVTLTVPRRASTSEEAADALERAFGIGDYADSGGELNMSPDRLLADQFSAAWYGNAALSESWRYDPDADLYWPALWRRQQVSLDRYIVDQMERLVAIVQQPTGFTAGLRGSGERLLPMRETLFQVLDQGEGGFDGVSLLRTLYPHWRSEQARYRQEDVAAHRYSVGIYDAALDVEKFLQANQSTDTTRSPEELVDEEHATMATTLQTLDNYNAAHFVRNAWWDVRQLGGNGVGAYDPAPLLASAAHHQRVQAEALFVAFITQGRQGDGGSRSMVETQAGVVGGAVFEWVQWLVRALNRQTVARFLKANFASLKPEERPWIGFEGVKVPEWLRSPAAFVDMVQAGLISPQPEDEQKIRAQLGLAAIAVDDSPSGFDRQAARAGGRDRTARGVAESRRPSNAPATVNRLVERGTDTEPESEDT